MASNIIGWAAAIPVIATFIAWRGGIIRTRALLATTALLIATASALTLAANTIAAL